MKLTMQFTGPHSGEATFQSIKISYAKELADMDTLFFFFFKLRKNLFLSLW